MYQTKVCTRCGEEKIEDQFRPRPGRPGTRYARCRDCDNAVGRERYDPVKFRTRALRKLYGMSYEEWVERSKDGCEICGSHRNLSVDHCHAKGHVRGILCANCNHALGKAQDSPEILRRLANYLEQRA